MQQNSVESGSIAILVHRRNPIVYPNFSPHRWLYILGSRELSIRRFKKLRYSHLYNGIGKVLVRVPGEACMWR